MERPGKIPNPEQSQIYEKMISVEYKIQKAIRLA